MDQDPKQETAKRNQESDETRIRPKDSSEPNNLPTASESSDSTEVMISAQTDNNRTGKNSQFDKTVMSFDDNMAVTRSLSAIGSGSVLKNRYDLLEKIGTGGMGCVYKALDRRDIEAGNSTFIGIKVLNDEFRADPELLKALHSEARKTQSLAHPNILTVYDFDRDGQTVFMTMEYLEGVTLDKIIKNNPAGLKQQDVMPILRQIGSALGHAHGKGIIHSDFKPSNVFIDISNRVKVLDFGIARLQNFSRVRNFDAGTLKGVTPAYAALEMLQGGTPDPRDDIYAMACVAYELFTGRHPFAGARIDECMKKNLHPKRIQTLNSNQWNALKKALAFRREDRTGNVEALIDGLQSAKRPSRAGYYAASVILLSAIALTAGHFLDFSLFDTHESDVAIERPIEKVLEEQSEALSTKAKETGSGDESSPTQIETGKNISHPIEPLPDNALPGSALSVSINKTEFKIGESLVVDFEVAEPLYVYIAVVNAAGSIAWVFPNPYQESNYCIPGTRYRVPPESGDFTLDIGEPKGTDKLIAIAGVHPLPINKIDIYNPEKLQETHRVVIKTMEFTIN